MTREARAIQQGTKVTTSLEPARPIGPDQPSAARVYDALSGGSRNFAADRVVAGQVRDVLPRISEIVRENRSFVRRAVRHALDAGITQFLDLGCGIPVGDEVFPATASPHRVAYVDCDPTAVLYRGAAVAGVPGAVVLDGDLRRPEAILAEPRLCAVLDLSRPVAILMTAVLPFVADGAALNAALHAYHEAATPGSHLILTHASTGLEPVADLYQRCGIPLLPRSPERVAELLAGWRLAGPGLVAAARWRAAGGVPADEADPFNLAAVGVR